jgi:site-specific recombinase XerD
MALPDELEDLWHDFRRYLARRDRSESTVSVYRKSFEQFWTWATANGAEPDVAAIDYKTINRWTDYLLSAPATRNGRALTTVSPATGEVVPRPIEPTTRRIRYVNLRPFFTWWSKEFDRPNPFDRADPPGDPASAPIPVVSLDDIRRLVGVCNTPDFLDRRDRAIVLLLFDTGARLGELLAMTVDDWDRRNDLVILRGKTGERAVPTSAEAGEAISRYLRARKEHPKAKLPTMWLASKGALGDSGVAQLLRRRCAMAGLEPIHPHQARHTFCHEFQAEGGSENELMYLAGWKSTAMASRYGRSAPAQRAQASLRRRSIGDRL